MSYTPFSVIFLAGGVGARMGTSIPKQYVKICQKPLALYSFEVLMALPEVQDFIVVCDPAYHALFQDSAKSRKLSLRFALPGRRRQDSVFNAAQLLEHDPLVCLHDAVRPLIEETMIRRVVETADHWEAAALGVKARSTIRICDGAQVVVASPDRASLWEVQTPQVIRLSLLNEGLAYAQEHRLTVPDDVSLVDALGQPVKIVEGSYANIKVTTPEELAIVEYFIEKHVYL